MALKTMDMAEHSQSSLLTLKFTFSMAKACTIMLPEMLTTVLVLHDAVKVCKMYG